MIQRNLKQRREPDFGRNESSHVDHIDAFILNPNASKMLVWRLLADTAWDIACEEPDLVIFVRSTSASTKRKDGERWL